MPRPLNPDRRDHQVKFRFTTTEYAALMQHAVSHGSSLNAWGRAQLLSALRAPPPTRRQAPPQLVLPLDILIALRSAGLKLNDAAHIINGKDSVIPVELNTALQDLDGLLRQHAPALLPDSGMQVQRLDPAAHLQLKKIAVNLTQIERRLRSQKLTVPPLLLMWAGALRDVLNGEVRAP